MAAFRYLFLEIACWPTGIPFDRAYRLNVCSRRRFTLPLIGKWGSCGLSALRVPVRGLRDWNSRRDRQSLRHRYAAINRQQDMRTTSFRLFRCFCSLAVSIWERARSRVLSMRSSEGCSTPVAHGHWAYRSRFSGVMVALLFKAFPFSQSAACNASGRCIHALRLRSVDGQCRGHWYSA